MTRAPVFLFLMGIAGVTHAAPPFFVDCESALGTPPFRALVRFYASHTDAVRPSRCFRLDDREFLVIVNDSGRVAQGLYHFDARTGTYALAGGAYRPNLSVEREFDMTDKHFALLESSNLHAGEWTIAYSVLYLQPKTKGRPYVIQPLLDVQQDPEEGMCGARMKTGVAAKVTEIAIAKTCSDAEVIEFHLATQACPDGATADVRRRFRWNDQAFVEEAAP
jgi:hypothetical protein